MVFGLLPTIKLNHLGSQISEMDGRTNDHQTPHMLTERTETHFN